MMRGIQWTSACLACLAWQWRQQRNRMRSMPSRASDRDKREIRIAINVGLGSHFPPCDEPKNAAIPSRAMMAWSLIIAAVTRIGNDMVRVG